MSKYCDARQLEYNWYIWLLADATLELEAFRNAGVLWTKPAATVLDESGTVREGPQGPLLDPASPCLNHCIVFATPLYFQTHQGIVPDTGLSVNGESFNLAEAAKALALESDSPLHALDDNPFAQAHLRGVLSATGWIKQTQTDVAWHALLSDIEKMCNGIAMRFHQPTAEERQELAYEALVQVMAKLQRRRLVYTPGRASVFNLLTTTIYRCMYSIMNARTSRRRRQQQLFEQVRLGQAPHTRSLAIH